MAHIIWPSEPNLKTTGFVKHFTKTVEYNISLENQSLSTFFQEWKLLSLKEAAHLYYGEVYKIKEISPNYLILQIRSRSGSAYHYIDTQLNNDKSKVVMKIKTPDSAAYFYISWPFILLTFLTICSYYQDPHFSSYHLGVFFLYASIAISLGIFFLNFSMSIVKDDLKRAMHKKGLNKA